MKKRIFAILIAAATLLCALSITALADDPWDGSVDTSWYNTTDTAFEIDSAADLAGLAELVNGGTSFSGKTINLGADIDLNNQEWTPIGTNGKPFLGTFDGAKDSTVGGGNYTISNLYINKGFSNTAANNCVGLFGCTNSPAVIKNVDFENVDIQGSLYVGTVVGYGFTGKEISNCHVSGKIEIDGWWYIGGIGGNGYVSTVSDCTVTGNEGSYIKANNDGSYVGGIWGYRGEGNMTITDCKVENIALSACDRIGGICGIAHYSNTIQGCEIKNSTITSTNNVGNTGLIAGADLSKANSIAKILDCTVTNTTATSEDVTVTTKVGSCTHEGKPAEKCATVGSNVTFNSSGKITEGTLEQVADGELADGLILIKNEEGTYDVAQMTTENAPFVVTTGSVEEPFDNLPAAIAAANSASSENAVTVTIKKSGSYDMFSITRANVKVEAADGVTATFTVSSTKTGNVNGENVTLEGLNFVSDDGTTIFSSGNCDGLTLNGCTFTGSGTGTALYIHKPNITITGCTFENFERGYYTCGDNSFAGVMIFTGNTFTNVRVPIDGYWGKTATNDTNIQITGNTFDSGDWDAAYIQLWDYAQYLRWADNTETDRQGSAIKARIENNTYIGSVVIYATHFDWFSESSLTLDDASKDLLQYRVLVELEGAESATVRNADGSEITAFNESKASSKRGDNVFIYSLSVGDYIFDIVPAEGSDPVPKEVTLKAPLVGEETNKVTVDAAETAVAKVGDDEYKTLAEAIEAAKNGATVELLRDVYVETWNQVWNTKGMTIEGKGKTITIGKVESNVNGNYLFYDAEDLVVNDLSIKFQTNGNGFDMVSGELKNVKMYGGANSNYAVFVCNGGANNAVTIESCTFKDFGIAVYSQSGTAATSNIKVTGSTITDCGIAICSYAKSNVFTGNTVTGSDELSFAGGADAVTTVTGNAFTDAGKIWFCGADLGNVTFEKNKVLGDTYVTTVEAEDGTTLDVDRNYWGGSAPSETQVVGENVNGKNVYYVAPGMNESDLNTYAPYTVILIFGNGMGNDVKNYKPNAQFKLPVPSKPGYIFMGWKCSDGHTHEAGETITVTKSLTFTAIWANMPDITPGTPGGDDEPVVPDFPFTDVREGQWFYEAVKYVYSEGIMNGMDRYTFAPNGSLTRAMVWTMLARLDGVDTEGGATWYSKAQDWAMSLDVSDGTNPMGEITRQELVTMLWRYAYVCDADMTLGDDTNILSYIDIDKVSDWAVEAFQWCCGAGIIEGDENGALNPTAGCTRAEAAAMFMRLCKNVDLSPTV